MSLNRTGTHWVVNEPSEASHITNKLSSLFVSVEAWRFTDNSEYVLHPNGTCSMMNPS